MHRFFLLGLSLVPLTLGREFLLTYTDLSIGEMGFWLGLLGVVILLIAVKCVPLRNPKLGWQRALAGAMSLIGIYGALLALGAPTSVSIMLFDTILLYRFEKERRGVLLLTCTILLLIATSFATVSRQPIVIFEGLAWCAVSIVGRVWAFKTWELQHEVGESRFWLMGLPLIGSGFCSLLYVGEFPHAVTGIWWVPLLVVSALGLWVYSTVNEMVKAYGSLRTRLAELMLIPILWLGHHFIAPSKSSMQIGIVSFLLGTVAWWAFSHRIGGEKDNVIL